MTVTNTLFYVQTKWEHVQWLKNGIMLLPTNRHFILSDGQLLVISELVEADSGVYQCESTSTGDMGPAYTLRVTNQNRSWGDFDKNTWICIVVISVIGCIAVTSGVWLMCIYCNRRKITSGGSSTGTGMVHYYLEPFFRNQEVNQKLIWKFY
jgi:hypothetical protein